MFEGGFAPEMYYRNLGMDTADRMPWCQLRSCSGRVVGTHNRPKLTGSDYKMLQSITPAIQHQSFSDFIFIIGMFLAASLSFLCVTFFLISWARC